MIEETVDQFFIDRIQKKEIFSPLLFFKKLTLSITCRLILGASAFQDSEVNKLSQLFLEILAGISSLLRFDFPLTKYRKAKKAKKNLEEYLRIIISKRRQNKTLSDTSSLLNILLEQRDLEGNSLSDLEIASQILAILFGSHDTTANLLCSIIVQLEFNPFWREKLRDELKDKSSKPTLFSKEDSNLFIYILNECLRINPPIYTIPRKVIKSFEIADCQVPEGWYIILSPLLTHRLPQLYPNPEVFDPLRFSPSRQEHKKHPFAFVGFGGGAHKCLGQDLAMLEVEVIVTYLLKHYFWRFHNNLDNSDFLKHTLKRIKSLKISLNN